MSRKTVFIVLFLVLLLAVVLYVTVILPPQSAALANLVGTQYANETATAAAP